MKVFFDIFDKVLYVLNDLENMFFVEILMKVLFFDEILLEFYFLLEKFDFKKIDNVFGEENFGIICVFDVDVFFEKDYF